MIKFIILFCYLASVFAEDLPTVKINNGMLRGHFATSYGGKKYIEFAGVPYAEPPINNLRLEDPVPKQPWTGAWIANHSAECIQVNHYPEPEGGRTEGVEDCLYLNVHVPGTTIDLNKKKDVIVYIHGGALMFGSTKCGGPKFIMDRDDVIFVHMNYRLGVFGFLSTGDQNLPGNLGMKDQSLAMKWVRDNIEHFGGNKNSITLGGLSAGGASVHLHYFSPISRGLFERGISISGCALNPWTIDSSPLKKAKIVAKFVGCPDDLSELKKCLKQRPAAVLVEGIRLTRVWLYNPFSPIGVVIDSYSSKPFLPEHPYTMLMNKKVYNVPWISSMTTSEGLYPSAEFLFKPNYLNDLNENWDTYAPAIMHYMNTLPQESHAEAGKKMLTRYLDNKPISRRTFPQLVQLLGDRLFVVDWEIGTRLHAAAVKSPVYAYIYDYISEERPSLVFALTGNPEKLGVSHGDDILQMLTYPFEDMPEKLTKKDGQMKDMLINLWIAFAKTGFPNIKSWTQVQKECDGDFKYLYIGRHQELEMREAYEMGNRSFWESIPFEESGIDQSCKV